MYTPTEKILRPKPDHDYDSMAGMKKTFLFMAVREGTILQRKFACWCSSCAQMSAPGEGEMDTSYRCVECETWKQAEAGKGEYLKWAETSIARTDPAGIANAKAIALAHSRSLRDQLLRKFEQSNEPVWVGVQNRGENVLSTHKLKPLKTLSLLPLTASLPLPLVTGLSLVMLQYAGSRSILDWQGLAKVEGLRGPRQCCWQRRASAI